MDKQKKKQKKKRGNSHLVSFSSAPHHLCNGSNWFILCECSQSVDFSLHRAHFFFIQTFVLEHSKSSNKNIFLIECCFVGSGQSDGKFQHRLLLWNCFINTSYMRTSIKFTFFTFRTFHIFSIARYQLEKNVRTNFSLSPWTRRFFLYRSLRDEKSKAKRVKPWKKRQKDFPTKSVECRKCACTKYVCLILGSLSYTTPSTGDFLTSNSNAMHSTTLPIEGERNKTETNSVQP